MSTLLERFEAKVDRTPGHGPWGDCHLWTGRPTDTGYGMVHTDAGARLAHRVALALAGRRLDETTHHRCEVKLCVNTEHLEPLSRVAHPTEHRQSHCKRGHPLTDDNVYVRKDTGKRMCRRCQRERRARRYREVERVGRTL